jgi:hypothetical protein
MTQAALGHAFLDKSEPKVGGTVKVPPTAVRIWFTDDTQADKSVIEVFDSAGNQVDKKDTHGDAHDKSLLVVTVSPLRPGIYQVRWHAMCIDSHKTEGDFHFTVKDERLPER